MMIAPAFLLVVALTQGCDDGASSPLKMDSLTNADYVIGDGTYSMTNGEFRQAVVQGSATELVISVSEVVAFGHLDDDNEEDAAVVLVEDSGGSGMFYHLAALRNDHGKPKNVGTTFLGDRIGKPTLVIESGDVIVTMRMRLPDEPMATEPSVQLMRRFQLAGGDLVVARN